MAERQVRIPVGGFSLECLLEPKDGIEAAIICHPHPLYGGSMDNNVVEAARGAFASLGMETLRFNSRGVGGSGGRYDDGEGEVDDLLAVAKFLETRGKSAIHLAGYSFGSWIAMKTLARGLRPVSLTAISPPLDFLPFRDLQPPHAPTLVTIGDRDAFCSQASLKNWISSRLSPDRVLEMERFSDCDHFYAGFESRLAARIAAFHRTHFGGPQTA